MTIFIYLSLQLTQKTKENSGVNFPLKIWWKLVVIYSIMVAETHCPTCLTSWWPAAKSGAPPLRLPVRRLAAMWAGIESCPNRKSAYKTELFWGKHRKVICRSIEQRWSTKNVISFRCSGSGLDPLCFWLGDGVRNLSPSKNIWMIFPLVLKLDNRIRYATRSSGSRL